MATESFTEPMVIISLEEYNHLKSIEDTYLQDLEFIKNKLSKK